MGLECQFLVIDIKDEEDICVFIDHLLSSVQQMNAYIGYVWIDIGHWNFGLKAGMGLAVGDYPDNSLEGKKPYRFIIGRTYSKFINYPKRFHVNWTYTLEVPKTNLRHYLNENNKDAIQAFATLDDVFSHIQYSFVKRSSSQNPDEKWRKVFKKPLLS